MLALASGLLLAGFVLGIAACGGDATPSLDRTAETLDTAPEGAEAPTVAPGPTVSPTPEPTATRAQTTGPSSDASDRAGVWAGPARPGPATLGSDWLSLRVTPGEDPDVDLWMLEGGPIGLPMFRCSPQRQEKGWDLKDCVGLDFYFSAFVPAVGGSGLAVQLDDALGASTTSLTMLPKRNESEASGNVSLVWHQLGADAFHSDVWVSDGLVFAPHFDDRHIEILDAESGEVLGTASVPENDTPDEQCVSDVKAIDRLLYAATCSSGVVAFDVSEPATPVLIGEYRVFERYASPENFTDVHNVFLSPDGNLLYAISLPGYPSSDLRILDVSDPASPKEAGRFSIGFSGDLSFAHDVNVVEREGRMIAFLNYLEAGLWILDITDPASIVVLSNIEWDGIMSHSGWPFALGDRLYYAHTSEGYNRHLTILDVTDLEDPTVVSRFATREGLSIHNVEVVDGIAYISYLIDGLRVVDLRDPETPREVAHFDTVPDEDERDIIQGAWGVRVSNGIVYLSDMKTGTYAFRVDVP